MRRRWITGGGVACVLVAAVCWFALVKPGARPLKAGFTSTVIPFAGSAATTIRMVDRAAAAGLHFHLGHGGRSPLTVLDTAGCGCAFLDYDGDGLLDIFLVGQPHCALYRNRGDGTFQDVTEALGIKAAGTFMGVAVGDYDNDGRPDLLITGYGRNVLYHSTLKRFVDVTARSGLSARNPYDWATSAAFGDLDRDGKLDLAVGHYVQFTPRSLQTCDYNGVPAACPPFYYDSQSLLVFRGDGAGHFRDVTRAWGFADGHGRNLGVAPADFDGSGRTGLYVANDGLPADLWQNTAHGFHNVGAASSAGYDRDGKAQAGMGVDWGDYDNDGRPDLVVGTFQDQPDALYHNDGSGLFRFSSDTAGTAATTRNRLAFGAAFVDLDNDGWLDLLMANGHVQDTVGRFHPGVSYAQPTQVFRNLANGAFEDVTAASGEAVNRPIVGRGLAVGDYDNDGRQDALVVDLEGRPLLLHNQSTVGHWLGISLVGARSNRQGLGARITLASGVRQVREVQTGRSYLSASDPRVVFGLGKQTTVQSLTIRWPSGKTTTPPVGGIDRYLTVRE